MNAVDVPRSVGTIQSGVGSRSDPVEATLFGPSPEHSIVKRVQITIDLREVDLPPTFERATWGDEDGDFVRLEIANWNVSNPPAGFLVRLQGEYERFESVLRADPYIRDFELLPATETECYCFVESEGTATARALFENFTRGSLLTVPPVTWNRDGTSSFTLVGPEADIQAAVDGVPEAVDVTVESVGGTAVTAEGVVGRLSPRQRETVEIALDVGYYDVPRRATSEDVARELGCAPATAAEHLQKAEATVLSALLDG